MLIITIESIETKQDEVQMKPTALQTAMFSSNDLLPCTIPEKYRN